MFHRSDKPKFYFFTGWGNHFFYLKGNVPVLMGFGECDRGQLGLKYESVKSLKTKGIPPIQIPFFRGRKIVKNCFLGACHTLFETKCGEFFASGGNFDSRLSVPKKDSDHNLSKTEKEHVFQPERIVLGDKEPIWKVSAGDTSSFFISKSRNVYSAGRNTQGGLVLGHKNTVQSAQRIPLLSNIEDVIGGFNNAFFISSDNRMFVGGNNENGQLGIGESSEAVLVPVELTFFNDREIGVMSIALSTYSTFLLTEKNEVYHWGGNNSSVFGTGEDEGVGIDSPELSKTMGKVCRIIGFGDESFIFQALETGKWFVTGAKHLAVGYVEDPLEMSKNLPHEIRFPPPLNKLSICQVCTAYKNTFFLTDAGDIFGCGDATNFKLVIESSKNSERWDEDIKGIEKIEDPRVQVKKRVDFSYIDHKERLEFIVEFQLRLNTIGVVSTLGTLLLCCSF